MKIPYSEDYFPPAPVLSVTLAPPAESPQTGPHNALVETGADGTFVPTVFLEKLGAPAEYLTNVRSHLGKELRRVSVHKIDILFGTLRLPEIEVVGDDWGSEIIIGRNVLNKLKLLLDGPNRTTELK